MVTMEGITDIVSGKCTDFEKHLNLCNKVDQDKVQNKITYIK